MITIIITFFVVIIDNTEDIQTKNQNQNKNKNKNKNQDSRRSANVIIPNFEHFENHIINEPNIYKVNERKKCSSTRKVRHILGLLSTLPKDIQVFIEHLFNLFQLIFLFNYVFTQLSSSYSIELQIYKVSESLISSSIIALHHFLKYDSRGQVINYFYLQFNIYYLIFNIVIVLV